MNINVMRSEVESTYTGSEWRRRVRKMKDNQVIAIYHNLLKSGKIDLRKKKAKKTIQYEQLKFDI